MPRLEASCRAVHARRDRKSRFGKCEARSVWSVAGDMIDVMVERSDAALLRRSSRGGFHLAPSGSRAGSTLHELQYAMNTRAVDDHHAFEAFVAVGMWPVTEMQIYLPPARGNTATVRLKCMRVRRSRVLRQKYVVKIDGCSIALETSSLSRVVELATYGWRVSMSF